MSAWDAFWVGIAPHHRPAFVAALLVLLGAALLRTGRARRRLATIVGVSFIGRAPSTTAGPPTMTRRWAATLLGVGAAVHLALPLGHNDNGLLTASFLGSGVAFAWVALRALDGRSWRAAAALLSIATLVGYVAVTLGGGEEPDQLGIATALVELAVFGLAVVPEREPGRPRWLRRSAAGTATVGATVVVGAALWAGAFASHDTADVTMASAAAPAAAGAAHAHGHDHAARAQAGVVMRPAAGHHATPAQVAAARRLADLTTAATRRYRDIDAARADGYDASLTDTGYDVHLENDTYAKDGRTLDPERPEQLVYAIDGGKATLLGVVFVMERAGEPGPEPGGPITGWHAHNGCLTVLPPGFGVTSPYGGCPALSVQATIPEMMHVWTVDNPRGPYAEGLDEQWVRGYHATHGQ
jgi:hypothetical protein